MTAGPRSGDATLHPHPDAYDLAPWGGAVSRTPRAAAATWAPERDGVHQIALTEHQPLDILVRGLAQLDRPGRERVIFVCLGPAVRQRADGKAPYFFGLGVAKALDVPLISIADPTLALDPALSLAWYAGNADARDLPAVIAAALNGAAAALGARLLVFGPSGGGFAALALADRLSVPATLVAANPQTALARYSFRVVTHYLDAAFGPADTDTDTDAGAGAGAAAQLAARLRPLGLRDDVCSIAPAPGVDILYLQNMSDWHVSSHAAPYLRARGWARIGPTIFADASDRRAMYFGDWGDGHAGIPGLMLRKVLSRLLAGQSPGAVARELAEGRERVAPVLAAFDPFDPQLPLRLKVEAARTDGQVCVRAVVRPPKPAGLTYAFYLVRDGQREAMRWYRPEPEAVFDIPEAPGRLSVRAFVRTRDGATTIESAAVADQAS